MNYNTESCVEVIIAINYKRKVIRSLYPCLRNTEIREKYFVISRLYLLFVWLYLMSSFFSYIFHSQLPGYYLRSVWCFVWKAFLFWSLQSSLLTGNIRFELFLNLNQFSCMYFVCIDEGIQFTSVNMFATFINPTFNNIAWLHT